VDEGLLYVWLLKAVIYGLGQLAIGIAVVHWLTGSDDRIETLGRRDPRRWLGTLSRVVATLILTSLSLKLWVQTASAFGADAWLLDNLRVIALESRWGQGWRLQMLAAFALFAAAWLPLGWRPARVAFGLSSIGLALSMPLLGHAAGSSWRYVVHAVHNLGAAAWLGALGVVTIAAWRAREPSDDSLVRLTRRFSPLALAAAAAVATSGVVVAWIYVGSWAAMWTTEYGRWLTMKLLGVMTIVVCGWTNWRQVRAGRQPRRAVMTLEWMMALVVLGLTGALTETEHP
jgi:putative copper export protein